MRSLELDMLRELAVTWRQVRAVALRRYSFRMTKGSGHLPAAQVRE